MLIVFDWKNMPFCTCFFPLFLCSLLNENEVNLRARQSFRLKKFFILNLLL